MNIHLARPADVVTDEHGSYATVKCGAVGSYYSTRRDEVTCAECLAAPADFTVGQRVMSHPATDAFMRGDQYGTVVKIGVRYVHVRMDRSQLVLRFDARNVRTV